MAKKPTTIRKPISAEAPASAATPAKPPTDPAPAVATPPVDPASPQAAPPAPPPAASSKAEGARKVLVVTGPRNGFRRAGRPFGAEPVRIPLDELGEDELASIIAEPALVSSIEEADGDDA